MRQCQFFLLELYFSQASDSGAKHRTIFHAFYLVSKVPYPFELLSITFNELLLDTCIKLEIIVMWLSL